MCEVPRIRTKAGFGRADPWNIWAESEAASESESQTSTIDSPIVMRRTVLLVLFVTILASPAVDAQPAVSVRGNIGAAFFQSPRALNSVLNSGVDFGLGAGIRLHGGLELEVQGSFDRFTLNGDNVALFSRNLRVGPSSRVHGGDYNFLNASVGFRYVYRNGSNAHPYLSAGVGIYRSAITKTKIYQSGRLVQTSPRRSTTDTGFHLAMGIDFQIDDTYTFFFEPRYVVVGTKDDELGIGTSTRYIPVRLGIDVEL